MCVPFFCRVSFSIPAGAWGDCMAEGKIGLRLALKVVTDNAIAIFIPIECRLIVFYTFSRYTNP